LGDGSGDEVEQNQNKEESLELDLEEVEAEISMHFMAIGVFYSRKSYNPKFLFSNMLNGWGIPRLASVKKLGDYYFKLEFLKEEEKNRVVDGGPWRHKGDTLIVVHYDGLTRPSEVCINSIGLWVHFLDLPPTMMKECFAKLLSGQLGRYIKMDSRYQGYLHVRVDFPLQKALQPSLTVRIKRRGAMVIALRYENVPHFCFHCGCESASSLLVNFDVLNDNLIKGLISCVKYINMFLMKVQMYLLIYHLKYNHEENRIM
jgi:hypothetical protein